MCVCVTLLQLYVLLCAGQSARLRQSRAAQRVPLRARARCIEAGAARARRRLLSRRYLSLRSRYDLWLTAAFSDFLRVD